MTNLQFWDLMKYYSSPATFKILKQVKNKEVALLNKHIDNYRAKRFIRFHNTNSMNYVLNIWFKKNKDIYSFYSTNATLIKGCPVFNGVDPDTDKQYFTDNFHKLIVDYPLFIDIDCPDHEQFTYAVESAILLHDLFNKLNVNHKIRFSGMGFHFIIDHNLKNYSYDMKEENNIYDLFREIAVVLHNNFSMLIDLVIYDPRRLIKVPFTATEYDNKLYVCTPITSSKELKLFKLDKYLFDNIKVDILDIEDHVFNPNGDIVNLIRWCFKNEKNNNKRLRKTSG